MSIGQIVALLEPPLDGLRGEKGNSSSATTSSTAFSTEHTAHRLAPTFSHCRVTKDDDARKCGVPLVFSGPSPRVYLSRPRVLRLRMGRDTARNATPLVPRTNRISDTTNPIFCYSRVRPRCSPNRSVRIAIKHVRVEACWLNWFE